MCDLSFFYEIRNLFIKYVLHQGPRDCINQKLVHVEPCSNNIKVKVIDSILSRTIANGKIIGQDVTTIISHNRGSTEKPYHG